MESVIQIWKSKDLFAAIESLLLDSDLVKAAKSFVDLSHYLYWKEKNLPAFVLVSSAGISYAIGKASEMTEDEPLSHELRGIAKGMSYDLGSFTWPGWDEPGIEIGPTDLQIGQEAARANLRLAQELQRGDLPLSRAYWLIGAHDLAAGDWTAARKSFELAENHAQAAGETVGALLNTAYQRLAEALADPVSEEKRTAVLQADEELGKVEGGKDLQRQVLTALRVFLSAKAL